MSRSFYGLHVDRCLFCGKKESWFGSGRMKRRDLECMVGYVKSVENEICLDQGIYALCGLSPKELGYLPRPAKLLNRLAGRRALVRAVASVVRMLWRYGGAVLFFVREWRVLAAHLRRAPAGAGGEVAEVAFCSGNRSVEVIRAALPGRPLGWLTLPWAPVDTGKVSGPIIDVFSLLDKNDLRRAFWLSVRAVAVLSRRPRLRDWVLQSYTAMRWFCVYLALEKGGFEHLVTADHFDRWALLVDGLMSRKRVRARGVKSSDMQLTLVQHGDVRALDQPASSESRLPFVLRYKLNAVTRLYVFDEHSRLVFENDILASRCRVRGVEVQRYAPLIDLVSLPAEHKVKVLFVGHPICESIQIEVFKCMVEAFKVSVYYKPHPTAGMSALARSQGWTVIEDKRIFPAVDLIVSYPSTLVQEYAGQGVGAVMHPLHGQEGAGAGIFADLQSKLTLLGCERIQP
jgi:hypothetical protein